MKTTRGILLLLVVSILLNACGGVQKVVLKPESLQPVKHITIIKNVNPDVYSATDAGNPSAGLGLIGGIIIANSSAEKTKSLAQVIANSKFDFSAELTQKLIDKLQNQNYQVSTISVERPSSMELLQKYPNTQNTDAFLDITVMRVGYSTQNFLTSAHWRPSAQLLVGLVQSQTNETLFRDKIMYGLHSSLLAGTDLDAPEKYNCSSADELFSNEKRVVDGLKGSAEVLAEYISDILKKKKNL